jgi:hypothetical protein
MMKYFCSIFDMIYGYDLNCYFSSEDPFINLILLAFSLIEWISIQES